MHLELSSFYHQMYMMIGHKFGRTPNSSIVLRYNPVDPNIRRNKMYNFRVYVWIVVYHQIYFRY